MAVTSPWLHAADLIDPPVDPHRDDPVGFVQTVLGFTPWSKQREILEAVRDHNRVAVRSCHGIGKTAIAARAVLWFLATRPNSRVITTAPTWQQVEQILWREIRVAVSVARDNGYRLFPAASQGKLELGDEWFALGLSTDRPERFQGHHAEHLLLVVDEASGVDERIFEAAEGFMTGHGAHILLIGNPTQVGGQFHRAFTTERAAWHQIHVAARDTPNYTGEKVPADVAEHMIRPGWVEERAQAWGVNSTPYEVRVNGDFPSHGDDAVIPLKIVEAAQERELPADVKQDMIVIACDVARYGDDETVIGTKIGPQITIRETYIGQKPSGTSPGRGALTETAGRILRLARQYPEPAVRIVIDDAGVGGGVTDILREKLREQRSTINVTAFNGAERAFDPDEYPNRRSELWFTMADRLEDLDLDPDEQLTADLTAPIYRIDSSGRRVVEQKAETKKRLGRSPDRADFALLTLVPAAASIMVMGSGETTPVTAPDDLGPLAVNLLTEPF